MQCWLFYFNGPGAGAVPIFFSYSFVTIFTFQYFTLMDRELALYHPLFSPFVYKLNLCVNNKLFDTFVNRKSSPLNFNYQRF